MGRRDEFDDGHGMDHHRLIRKAAHLATGAIIGHAAFGGIAGAAAGAGLYHALDKHYEKQDNEDEEWFVQVPYKPNQSRQEMLVDQALQSAMLSPEQIRQIRPVVPQQLMPQNRGFAKKEVGILEVLNTPRTMPTYRSWISGAPVMFRDGFMEDNWDGSSRYSMQGLWA